MAIVMKKNKRHVNDINMAVQPTPLAMGSRDGQASADECSATEDNRISHEENTMVLIKQISTYTHQYNLKWIIPLIKHQNGKLPIPDIKVWI